MDQRYSKKKNNRTFNLDEELEKAFSQFRQRYFELNGNSEETLNETYNANISQNPFPLERTVSEHASQTNKNGSLLNQTSRSGNRTYTEQMLKPLNETYANRSAEILNNTFPAQNNQSQRADQTISQQRSKSLNRSYADQSAGRKTFTDQRINQTYSDQTPLPQNHTFTEQKSQFLNTTFDGPQYPHQRFINQETQEEDTASIGSFAQNIGKYKDEIRQIVDKHDTMNNTPNQTMNNTYDFRDEAQRDQAAEQTFVSNQPRMNSTFKDNGISRNISQNQTYNKTNGQIIRTYMDQLPNGTFNDSSPLKINATFPAQRQLNRTFPQTDQHGYKTFNSFNLPNANRTFSTRYANKNVTRSTISPQQPQRKMPLNSTFTGNSSRNTPDSDSSYQSFEKHMDEYKRELRSKINSTRHKSDGSPPISPDNTTVPSTFQSDLMDSSYNPEYLSFEVLQPEWSASDPPVTNRFPEHPSRNLLYESKINEPEPVKSQPKPLINMALFEAHAAAFDDERNRQKEQNTTATRDCHTEQFNGYMTINDKPCFGTFTGYVVK